MFINSGLKEQRYQNNLGFIEKINKVQKSWKAVVYPEYQYLSMEALIQRAGGRKSKING